MRRVTKSDWKRGRYTGKHATSDNEMIVLRDFLGNSVSNLSHSGINSYVDMHQRDGIETKHLIAYSVCHFGNDLCASMWFVYLNYYLLYVVQLSPTMTACALLSGQIFDGLMTPTVGMLSDKCKCPLLGRRNTWYYFGTCLVIPSFLCVFLTPTLNDTWCRTAWYLTFPALFNIGWAAVQISTMSIVNELTYSQEKRDFMINSRNGFTYSANIFVLALAFILFS